MTARTLVLLRHGKSAYPDGVDDHDRPLADRGRREAALAGEWLAREGISVDVVLCSTATRTRQTLKRTGIAAPVTFVDELYGGAPDDILETVRIYAPSDAATVLVVGHVPGMPDTAMALDRAGRIDRFPTSAYAVLQVAAPWGRIGLDPDDQARLNGVQIPRAH